MKKHNTFKVVLGTALLFVILSWIIPAAYYSGEFIDQGLVQAGLFDFFNYSLTSLSYFGYISLYVIFVGGFYGVLNKIPAYHNLLEAIANKVAKKEKVVLAVIMILLAVIVSVCGIEIEMFLFVPFLVSLILLMGFDKIVAALTIVGSSLVGVAGATYAYNKVGTLMQFLSLDITSDIYVKLMILLVGLVLLIFNTLLYIKKSESTKVITKKEDKKEVEEVVVEKAIAEKIEVPKREENKKTTKSTNKSSSKKAAKKTNKSSKSSKSHIKAALKDDEVIVVKEEEVKTNTSKKQRVWPIAVVFSLLLVLVLLAFCPWSSSFGVTWFDEAKTAVNEFTLFEFPIFAKLLGTYNSFGTWMPTDLFFPLTFFILMLALIYKVKLSEVFEGFANGAKKAIGPAGMILVIYTILVLVTYHPFQLTIYKAILGLSKGFNVVTATVVAMLAGLFNGDIAYSLQSVLPYYTSVVTNTDFYSAIGVLFQSVYGVTMLVAPTSLTLMVVLTYLDIPYTKWLKNIWKFLLEFFVLILIVIAILVLL